MEESDQTTIRVKVTTREKLEKLKIHSRQSVDEVINQLIELKKK